MYWDQSRENISIMGHRGVRALYPENTMLSFRKAVEYGLDGIETDVHLTTDGQLVLHHDEMLERTTNGTGNIETYSYADLRKLDAGIKFNEKYAGQYIPRLEELLELVQKCQNMGVEPFGFGKKAVRQFLTFEDWNNYHWRDRFSQADVGILVDIKPIDAA